MPPAISDEENSDFDDGVAAPIRQERQSRSTSNKSDLNDEFDARNGDIVDVDDEDGDDDEDLDEDEFIVEAIRKHTIDEDGTLKFQVKWEGYESKADMTWEPEENLKDSAADILDEYFERIGGRDKIFKETEKASKSKKRGRPSSSTPSTASKRSRRDDTHPSKKTPPATANKRWSPPAGSWEDEIESIDACEDEGSGKLLVYLVWNNGQKTRHDTEVIYKKCPQRMLRFYERHVKIIREDLNRSGAD